MASKIRSGRSDDRLGMQEFPLSHVSTREVEHASPTYLNLPLDVYTWHTGRRAIPGADEVVVIGSATAYMNKGSSGLHSLGIGSICQRA